MSLRSCPTHGPYVADDSTDFGETWCPECAKEKKDAPKTRLGSVGQAREEAFDALLDYGLLAREWNTPDDDHTRIQLAALLKEVTEAVFREV